MNQLGSTRRIQADEAGIAEAAGLLAEGRLVAFPTETVYGLGADATRADAVAGIYAAKERPRFNPLIGHVADLDAARREGLFDATALVLAQAFWPGPLTLVVPVAASCSICDLARAGLDSVGLRVPAHPLARALLRQVGKPIAAPSANRSGHVSPTDADHVLSDLLGRIDAVLDGGAAAVGVESTIVSCVGANVRLLRPGGVAREDIVAAIGRKVEMIGAGEAIVAPGMLASHYAPRARVRLNATDLRLDEVPLGFAAILNITAGGLNLSESGDLREAAMNLFSHLRRLDASGAATIAVAPIPYNGLGEAINDRLSRAAADRD